MADDPIVPFRWNVSRREQLGSLLDSQQTETYPRFFEDITSCCVRLIAQCDDADFVFVGRSPESLFDHLSGLLSSTSWRDRCVMANISWRSEDYWVEGAWHRVTPSDRVALQAHLTAVGLTPEAIARGRPTALVDVVATAGTLGTVSRFLMSWAKEAGVDPAAVRRQLRILGLTMRTKTSPNTWRWYQQVAWAAEFPRRSLKSVSVPADFWSYIADLQEKVALTNPPWRWQDSDMARPTYTDPQLRALAAAVQLYDLGASSPHRQEFARRLAQQPEMKTRWLRSLVMELKRG